MYLAFQPQLKLLLKSLKKSKLYQLLKRLSKKNQLKKQLSLSRKKLQLMN